MRGKAVSREPGEPGKAKPSPTLWNESPDALQGKGHHPKSTEPRISRWETRLLRTALVLRFLKDLNLCQQRLLIKVQFSRLHSIDTVSRSRAGTPEFCLFNLRPRVVYFDAQPGLGTAALPDIQSLFIFSSLSTNWSPKLL